MRVIVCPVCKGQGIVKKVLHIVCVGCFGSGKSNGKTCVPCEGTGKIRTVSIHTCFRCFGTGKTIEF